MRGETKILGVLSAIAVSIMPVAASVEQLSGNELKQFVAGKRVYLATPFGGEFPLNYKQSGTVTGDGTALGLGRFFAPKESGKWWVKGENLSHLLPDPEDRRAFAQLDSRRRPKRQGADRRLIFTEYSPRRPD